MVVFHKDLFTSLVIYFIVLALWGFFLFFRGQRPSGSYLPALAIGEALILIQSLSGLLLVATGHSPEKGFLHWLYGIVLVLTLPVVYSAWAGRADDRRASIYLALASTLVVIIAAARSSMTG